MIETQTSLQELKTSRKIKEAIDINKFIALSEEIVDNIDKDLVDQIVGRYGAAWGAETDEKNDFKEPVKLKQAMEALKILKL